MAGKLVCIASLIYTLRPFLSDIFAAIYSEGEYNAPPGCAWVKQIRHVLLWLVALLSNGPSLQRHYLLSVYKGQGDNVEMCFDASL